MTAATGAPTPGVVVNDVHSLLNETRVADIVPVDSLGAVQAAVRRGAADGLPVCIAGGRHAMGGQQFCDGGLLVATRPLDRVLAFDREQGRIQVEGGLQWPALLAYLDETQRGAEPRWAIAQKQTGADRLSLGGAVAANVHGRGLAMPPFVADVEEIVVVDASGDARTCSRTADPDLFRLVVGGYGLFGVVYSVTLRLVPRQKLERVVEVIDVEQLMPAVEARVADGFLYGDFQFAIEPADEHFLTRGVFSCYRPVAEDTPVPEDQRALTREDWKKLLYLAHTDKAQAWELYTQHYLATSGQIYYSDAHQFADYVDGYHAPLDTALEARHASTEMISEIYVPRERLTDFMHEAAERFRHAGTSVIYGTVRLIERDDETFLAWARERWACIIFNLCVAHTPDGIERAADAFRGLIDLAIAHGGSYYLTYHRWAGREQVEACYPKFEEFLARKRRHDPHGVFQSDWYRHHLGLFGVS